jgi:hypothetical protein
MVTGEIVLEGADDVCAHGVKVTLEGDGVRRETRSTVFGDFEFDGLAADRAFRLTVAHDGYAPREIDVHTRRDVDLAEIVLTAS